jgi:DNA-binding CsgD family transcriptional regulator
MPNKNSELLKQITKVKNAPQMLRVLSVLAEGARVGYVELPEHLPLLKWGVLPRLLTNFPEPALKNYLRTAAQPFSAVARCVATQSPILFSEFESKEECCFFDFMKELGFLQGVIMPINGSHRSSLIFAFNWGPDSPWVERFVGKMQERATIVNLVIKSAGNHYVTHAVPGFTARVKEILTLKTEGYTNQQVGVQLGIKQDTVKKTLKRATERLGGVSTTELIYHLTKLGLL